MKKTVVLLSLALTFWLAAQGGGSPISGKRALGAKRIEGDSNLIFREKFRGGERACVIVMGDHKPPVDLGVYIYDEKDRLVAEDKGGGEYVAAIWYPPRDAVYKIKIHNSGQQYNACYISLK